MTATPEDEQWDIRKIILLTWLGATMLITIVLVTTSTALMLIGGSVPSELNQWAGIALGFLFGTGGSILKDFVIR